MFHLVYASTATKRFSAGELFELLPQYRAKNVRLSVTGMLLYKVGAFMQALEGEEETVRSLYATICADVRHYDVHTLLTITVGARQFPDWSMGFEDLGVTTAASVMGFRPLRELPPWVDILPWRASVAMKLLASFNERE